MTYRPVQQHTGKGGRKPLPIPPALLSLLEQSYKTGQRVEIERSPDDPPGSADELRRTLVRAGYTHFPHRTIHKRVSADRIVFWMTAKRRQQK